MDEAAIHTIHGFCLRTLQDNAFESGAAFDLDEVVVTDAQRELDEVFARFRELWATSSQEIADLLKTSPALNRRSYTAKVVQKALAAAAGVAGSQVRPASVTDDFRRLTPQVLEQRTKSGQSPPTHVCFDLCGRFVELVDRFDALAKPYLPPCLRKPARAR